ncbi:unnamed protein product [Lathyrus oleraceus]
MSNIEKKMIEEKRKQLEQEMGDSISLDRTPSPPARHEKWNRAHQRKCGEFTSEATREVAEKINALVERSIIVLFILEDCYDFLVEAIGTEEHLGHVRGLGIGIDFKSFYGRS